MAIIRSLTVIVSILFATTFVFAEPLPHVSNLAEQYKYFIQSRKDKESSMEIMDKISLGNAETFYAEVYDYYYQPFQFKFEGVDDNILEIIYPIMYHTNPEYQHQILQAVHYPVNLGNKNVDEFIYDFALQKFHKVFPININIEVDESGGTAFNYSKIYTYILSRPKNNSNFISIIYFDNANMRKGYAYPEALNFDLDTGKLLYADDFIIDKQKFLAMEDILLARANEAAMHLGHLPGDLFTKGAMAEFCLKLNNYTENYMDFIDAFDLNYEKETRLNLALDNNGIVLFFRTAGSHTFGIVCLTLHKDELENYGLRADFWD